MLNTIEALSAQGSLLTLDLADDLSGLLVDEVVGLGPVKATLSSSSFAQLDGSTFQSARRDERNIVLKITLEPDWAIGETVKNLRDRIYSAFMPKRPVGLRFYDDTMPEPVFIEGYVESCEPGIFTSEPNVEVSIVCNNPDFYEVDPIVVNGNTTATDTETLIEYDGTVETGMVFTLNVNRALTAFTIYLRDPAGNLGQLDYTGSLEAGDVVKISTTAGQKYARLLRAGNETSVLFGVSPQSKWLEFEPGENHIRVYAIGAAIPFTIDYIRKYGGL